MGIDSEPRTRGVTRIREMVDYGINVATAQIPFAWLSYMEQGPLRLWIDMCLYSPI